MSKVGYLTNLAKSNVDLFHTLTFTHVLRKGNGVAPVFTQHVNYLSQCQVWLEDIHAFLHICFFQRMFKFLRLRLGV